MPATKPATKIPTANRQPARTKNGNARAVPPLTWSATEYVPKKRWWWYVAFSYVVATVALLLLAFGNWSAAMVAFVIGVTIVVLYLAKPRVWTYTLESEQLVITSGKRTLRLALEQFRAFTTEIVPQRGREAYVLIVLLPRGRFTASKDIYLSGDDAKDLAIAEALNLMVPFEEEPTYEASTRLLDRLARWLRIG